MLEETENILQDAASSGSADTFNAVLGELVKLGSDEVQMRSSVTVFDLRDKKACKLEDCDIDY